MQCLVESVLEKYRETGERVTYLIDRIAVSQAELSRLTGVAAATISRISKGEQVLGEKVIRALASVVDVNPDWLRSGKGEPGTMIVQKSAARNESVNTDQSGDGNHAQINYKNLNNSDEVAALKAELMAERIKRLELEKKYLEEELERLRKK